MAQAMLVEGTFSYILALICCVTPYYDHHYCLCLHYVTICI